MILLEQEMNAKHKNTLKELFEEPPRSDIAWSDIEGLLKALGADISEGAGSRVRIALNGVRAVFHRPRPHKETDKGALKSMRRFLREAGVLDDAL
jgi:hypothetical protein